MRRENGKIEGNLVLGYDLELHGMVTGRITVQPGVALYLHGTCGENLIAEDASVVNIHGMVTGNVENRGGFVKIYGTVIGRVFEISGTTFIDSNAIIHNKT